MTDRRVYQATLALLLTVLVAGCQGGTPAPQPTPGQRPATGDLTPVPAGAVVVGELQADLEASGSMQRVVVYRQEARLTIAVVPEATAAQFWRTALPGGPDLVDLSLADVDADRRPEILVETRGPQAEIINLCIIRWRGGAGQVLRPVGGPADGSDCFQSQHYRPVVDDLDMNGTWEVVVSVPGKNPHFFDTVVYEWDGEAFSHTDLYLMPPRVVPTAASTPSR